MLLLALFLLTASCPGYALTIGGSWRTLPQSFLPVEKLSVVCRDNSVIIFGGRDANSVAVNGMYEYTTATGRWIEIRDAGGVPPVFSNSLDEIGDELFLFGGNLDLSFINSDLWIYTKSTKVWRMGVTNDFRPTGRTRFSSITLPDKKSFVIMMGYTFSTMLNDAWEYNTVNKTWALVNDGKGVAPTPRFDPCCDYSTSLRSAICFGGTDINDDVNDVWAMSMVSYSWTKVTTTGPIPSSRRVAQCTVWQNKFLVHGGFRSEEGKTVLSTDVHVLDLTTFVWTSYAQPSSVKPREGGKMCTTLQGPWLMGGTNNLGGGYFNDLQQLGSDFIFKPLMESTTSPPKRTGHCSAMVGEVIYVLFGRNANGLLNDVWTYNTKTEIWKQLKTIHAPPGRWGSAASAVGKLLVITGGQMSLTIPDYTNEMWQLNTETGVFQLHVTKNPPAGRAFHMSTTVGLNIVIFGGNSAEKSNSGSMSMYASLNSKWYDINVSQIPGRRSFGMTTDPETEITTIFGGIANPALTDRWEVDPPVILANEQTRTATRKMKSTLVNNGVSRDFMRGEAAVAGYGSRYVICGGSISSSFPCRGDASCYQWDIKSGENTPMPPMPQNAYLSTASYFGKSFYVFGGQVSEGGIKRPEEFLNDLQIWTFDSTLMCPAQPGGYDLRDATCQYCSPGTIQPSCSSTPVGTYNRNPFTEIDKCPPGTYGDGIGAQTLDHCDSCAVGTYQDEYAATSCKPCPACAIGARSNNVSNYNISDDDGNDHPDEFSPLEVPWWVWGSFLLWAFCTMGTLAALAHIHTQHTAMTTKYYIPELADDLLDSVYNEFHSGDGLQHAELYNALSDPRLQVKGLNADLVSDLFREHDVNGSHNIDFEEFKLVVVDLLNRGLIAPFPGSDFETKGLKIDKTTSWRSMFTFRSVDFYSDAHRIGKVGDPIRIQKNTAGGMLWIVTFILFIGVVSVLVITFAYDNLTEARSSLPSTVATETPKVNVNVSFSIFGSDDIENCHGRSGECAAGTNITATGFYDKNGNPTNGFPATCMFSPPRTCTVFWICEDCIIKTSDADLQMLISKQNAFASRITIDVSSFTGISDVEAYDMPRVKKNSIAKWVINPSLGHLVFKGYPMTTAFAGLTPTLFRTPVSSFNETVTTTTGFHVQAVVAETTLGQTADEHDFNRLFGVPVKLAFSVADNTLRITRLAKQSGLQLVSGILGVVSALGAGMVLLLKRVDFINGKFRKWRHDEFESNATPGDTMFKRENSMDKGARDRKLIMRLLKVDVPFGVATEMLTLCRKVHREPLERDMMEMSARSIVDSPALVLESPNKIHEIDDADMKVNA